MVGLPDTYDVHCLVVQNKPLEWAGHQRTSAFVHHSLPATEGQRSKERQTPTRTITLPMKRNHSSGCFLWAESSNRKQQKHWIQLERQQGQRACVRSLYA